MHSPAKSRKILSGRLALTAFRIACHGALASIASAQVVQEASKPTSTSTADDTIQMDTFTVTGSNIKRLDQESFLPVTAMSKAEIEIRDASQPADLMLSMPQITSLPNNETSTLNQTARGDNASIAMRGLPSGNTLVLLNGRRLVPHAISQSESGTPALSVNINQLPNRGIERVELLTDGSSAIYGTDAVAGVVNYLMNRNYSGTELQTRFAQTNYGDGQEYRATLTTGRSFLGGRGHYTLTADYYHRDVISVADRPFAAEADNSARAPAPWNVSSNTSFNYRAASSEYGYYTAGRINANGSFTGTRQSGIPSSMVSSAGNFYLVPNASDGVSFQTSTPSRVGVTHDYYWNSNPYRVIQPKSDRLNAYLGFDYALTPSVTFYGDLAAYRAVSETSREMDFVNTGVDGDIIVPASNPWNPLGDRFFSPTGAPNADGTPRLVGTPSAVKLNNKRFTDLPRREAVITSSTFRALAALKGRLGDDWTWDTGVLFSTGHVNDTEHNSTRRSLLIAALNQTDPAKAFNPFTRTFAVQNGSVVVTGNYANPESLIQSLQQDYIRNGYTRLASWDAKLSGTPLQLWGGNALAVAAGGEYRYEGFADVRPAYAGLNPADSGLDPNNSDFLSYVGSADTHGRRNVAALFAEAELPLAGKKFTLPGLRYLSLNGAGRFERYTDFGSTTKPKFGLNWRPLKWVLVRGSLSQGFHAPNLAQLFNGELRSTLVSTPDSYRSIVTGLPTDGNNNRINVSSGNHELKPERSFGRTAGIVIDIPFVKGLSVSADYWEIERRDIIGTGGGIGDDTAALLLATQQALASGKSINDIDLGSGTDHYLGDPSVVRLAVTQADRDFFASYNANQQPGNQRAVVGAIDYVRTTYFNRSKDFVNGIDFNLVYRGPVTSLGRFTLDSNWTRMIDMHAYNTDTSSRTENLNWNSQWKGSTTLSWKRKQWRAGLGFFFTSSFTDGATTSLTTWNSLGNPDYIRPVFSNGGWQYRHVVDGAKSWNLNIAYSTTTKNPLLRDTTIRLGAVNLFNAKPPLSNDSRGYDVGRYNSMARGVTYSCELTRKF